MISRYVSRFFHTTPFLRDEPIKSYLGALRRKTGYAISNCKKALELNNNDFAKAEMWLHEQAKNMGWEQVSKLKGRSASQGLIGLMIRNNRGVLVEINCETDFVAKNDKFKELVRTVSAAIFNHVPPINSARTIDKIMLPGEKLKNITTVDGTPLADHVALAVGLIRENIVLKRALCLSTTPELQIFGDVHPVSLELNNTFCGKYGALTVTKTSNGLLCPGKELCQHIIGMNPAKIGDPFVDLPQRDKDKELCLIYQEFLMEPTMNVLEILSEAKTEVLDYARFEVGEPFEENLENMEPVEVCG